MGPRRQAKESPRRPREQLTQARAGWGRGLQCLKKKVFDDVKNTKQMGFTNQSLVRISTQ